MSTTITIQTSEGTTTIESAEQSNTTINVGDSANHAAMPSLIYENTFDANSTGISAFNSATFSLDTGNGRVSVASSSADKGIYISGDLTAGATYIVQVNIAFGTAGAMSFYSNWATRVKRLVSGDNFIVFTMPAAGAFGTKIILANDATGINYVNYVKILQAPSGISADLWKLLLSLSVNDIQTRNNVIIGNLAGVLAEVGSNENVVIGKNSTSDQNSCVAIGEDATTVKSVTYDAAAAANGEAIAIGNASKAVSWRATAIGGKSIAGSTSSTSVGFGAYIAKAHGVGIGRGCYMPNVAAAIIPTNAALLGADLCHDIYINNGWGHRFSTTKPPVSISGVTPSAITKRYHGQDAYDELDGTDVNVAGGHVALSAGCGTGSGVGGEVLFETAPIAAQGSNQKNVLVTAGKFDASTTTLDSTRFQLLDLATGTYRRVKIGASDSGGSGKRMIYVDN